jgi:hypothetical protein
MQVVRFLGVVLGILLLSFLALVVGLLATNPNPDPAQRWLELAEMPVPRGEVGTAIVDGDEPGAVEIHVIGGFEGLGSASDRVSVYHTAQNVWDEAPRLPEPRHHVGAAALGTAVYVTGGAVSARNWTERDDLWVLPVGSAAWDELEPMPEPRAAHRMVAHDGRLYVIGGHGPSSRVLSWTPDDGWSTGAEMPRPRHHLAAVVREGEIWAIGGRDEDDTVLDRVDIYDPEADTWREGPALPTPVSAAVEGVMDGRIHLVGGEDPALVGGATFDGHLVLEEDGGGWGLAEPAPLAVHGAAGGVVDGRLHVIGGAARQGLLSALAWTGYAASYDPSGTGGSGEPGG